MPSASFTYTGSVQHWTAPAGVTSVNVDMAGASYVASAITGKGARVVLSGLTVLTVTPGNVYDIVVGQAPSVQTGGYSDGANGGNAGTGPAGYGGGGMSYITTSGGGKTSALVCAGGAGGSKGGGAAGGATDTTLDTEATTANAAGNGAAGGLSNGGGGGGGGWRGGVGGAQNNAGVRGTSMYRTTAVSGGTPTVTAEYNNTNGYVTLTYSNTTTQACTATQSSTTTLARVSAFARSFSATQAQAASVIKSAAKALSATVWSAFPSNVLLNDTAHFENGTGFWVASTGCTAARSTAQAFDGTNSFALTSTGAVSQMFALTSTPIALGSISAGTTYTLSGWVRSATVARTATVICYWYNGGSTYIGTFMQATATTTSTSGWTYVAVTGVAPAGALQVEIGVTINGSIPGAGEVHYVDGFQLAKVPWYNASFARAYTASSATSSTLKRQTGKAVAAASATSASLSKLSAKLLAATQAQSSRLGRSVGKIIASTQGESATLSRPASLFRTYTATQASTATVGKIRAFLRTLTATQAQAASAAKSVASTLSATQAQAASMVKGLARTFAAAVTTSAVLTKGRAFLRTLNASQGQTSTLTAAGLYARALTATATTVAAMRKTVGKGLAAAQTSAGSLVRGVASTLQATVAASPALTKTVGITRTTSSAVAASLNRVAARALTLTATQVTSAILGAIRKAPRALQIAVVAARRRWSSSAVSRFSADARRRWKATGRSTP